jgi:hypothetical protein
MARLGAARTLFAAAWRRFGAAIAVRRAPVGVGQGTVWLGTARQGRFWQVLARHGQGREKSRPSCWAIDLVEQIAFGDPPAGKSSEDFRSTPVPAPEFTRRPGIVAFVELPQEC